MGGGIFLSHTWPGRELRSVRSLRCLGYSCELWRQIYWSFPLFSLMRTCGQIQVVFPSTLYVESVPGEGQVEFQFNKDVNLD